MAGLAGCADGGGAPRSQVPSYDFDPSSLEVEVADAVEGKVPAVVGVRRLRINEADEVTWLQGSAFDGAAAALESCVPIDPLPVLRDPRPLPHLVTTMWVEDERGARLFILKGDETLSTRFNSDGRIWRSTVKRIYRCEGLLGALGVSPEHTQP